MTEELKNMSVQELADIINNKDNEKAQRDCAFLALKDRAKRDYVNFTCGLTNTQE